MYIYTFTFAYTYTYIYIVNHPLKKSKKEQTNDLFRAPAPVRRATPWPWPSAKPWPPGAKQPRLGSGVRPSAIRRCYDLPMGVPPACWMVDFMENPMNMGESMEVE